MWLITRRRPSRRGWRNLPREESGDFLKNSFIVGAKEYAFDPTQSAVATLSAFQLTLRTHHEFYARRAPNLLRKRKRESAHRRFFWQRGP